MSLETLDGNRLVTVPPAYGHPLSLLPSFPDVNSGRKSLINHSATDFCFLPATILLIHKDPFLENSDTLTKLSMLRFVYESPFVSPPIKEKKS